MSFILRAIEMGLTQLDGETFHYQDEHSEIIYRTLYTRMENLSMMGSSKIPRLAIYTKAPNQEEWRYVGTVSEDYRFEGNEVINRSIRENIRQVGTPIIREQVELSYDCCQMRNSIILNNPEDVNEVGNIYPQMTILNSYNGTIGRIVSFGIHMGEDVAGTNMNINFKKFGTISQVHHRSHSTQLTSPISNYIQTFSGNINDIIRLNFNNQLEDNDVSRILDLVEKIGVKTRRSVESVLNENREDDSPISSWQMFLSIARFTASTKSLNTKRMIENVAERVLVIPSQMCDMVTQTNEQLAAG